MFRSRLLYRIPVQVRANLNQRITSPRQLHSTRLVLSNAKKSTAEDIHDDDDGSGASAGDLQSQMEDVIKKMADNERTAAISGNSSSGRKDTQELLHRSMLLMTQVHLRQMVQEMQEQRKKQQEEQDKENSPEKRIVNLVPWWVSFLYKNFLAATLLVLYVLYVTSIKPYMDMKATFSGVKQNRITSEEDMEAFGCDRDDDCQKLKYMIDHLEPKKILMIIGAPDCGKTSLMEHLLTKVISRDKESEYDICHVALKGSAGGLDAFFTRLRSGFALEEPLLDSIMRKALHLQDSMKEQGQHSELVEMGTALERRLQVRSRVGLKRKNIRRVIFIDDCNTLRDLYDKGNGHVVQEFLSWFAQLDGCHVVMSANDGFIADLVRQLGLDRNVQYVVMNDCSVDEVRHLYDRLHDEGSMSSEMIEVGEEEEEEDTGAMAEDAKEKVFARLYDMFGGRIKDWKRYANCRPSERQKLLQLQQVEVNMLIANAVKEDIRNGWSPSAARSVFQAIVDSGDDTNVQNELLSIGKGNGMSSCGSGVSVDTLVRKYGVAVQELYSMSREKLISVDPTTNHVTFSSRLLYKQVRDHPELWTRR